MQLSNFISYYDNYDEKTRTYTQRRGSGLYSMLNWAIRVISLLELTSRKVDDVNIVMHEYMDNVDSFKLLFSINDNELSLSEMNNDKKLNFFLKTDYTCFGLGESPKDVDLEITNQIISKYFNPSPEVVEWYNNFMNHIGVSNEDIIFIWARRTDKQSEAKIPTVDTYLNVLSKINCSGKKILIQTDDQKVLDEFKNKNVDFITLPQIPFAEKIDTPFHINMSSQSDEYFGKVYGISKIDHLRQMIALAMIAKNAHKTILYPGNPTTFIPLFKGSFDNCILFKDDINLF